MFDLKEICPRKTIYKPEPIGSVYDIARVYWDCKYSDRWGSYPGGFLQDQLVREKVKLYIDVIFIIRWF